MVRINKGNEPKALKKAVKGGAKEYEKDLSQDVKDKLRNKLLTDQGYICCYCLKSIPEKLLPKSKIEHFKCRDKYKSLEVDYSNLFIACNGIGNGGLKTCDTLKDKSDINSFTLTNTNFERLIKYGKDGSILSIDTNIDKDLNDILGLNEGNLKAARYNMYLAIQGIKKRLEKGGNYQLQINKQIDNWGKRDSSGKFKAFHAVAIYYLK